MYVSELEIHDAETLDEAAAALAQFGPDARLLAGGTDLLVDLKTGRSACRRVVSINRIDSLRGVSESDRGLRIGALTTISQLARSVRFNGGRKADGRLSHGLDERTELRRDDVAASHRYAGILDAASQMAAPQIRNMATVGGNIVSAVPCADLPPILMCFGASCVIWSRQGERTAPLDSFFADVRKTILRPGEILTAVDVPATPAGFGAAYARFSLREGNAIAVAGVAASLRLGPDRRIQDARLALAAVSPVPKLVHTARDALVGRFLDDDAIDRAAEAAMQAAEPISDIRGSAAFRREVVGVLARRALIQACRRAEENLA